MPRALLCTLIAIAVVALETQAQERTPEHSPDSVVQRGKRIFEGAAGCHGCHGRDGRGTAEGPNLTDGKWLHGTGSLAELCDRVQRGVARTESKSGQAMPMGGWEPLAPADAEAVAAYVRWLARHSRREP